MQILQSGLNLDHFFSFLPRASMRILFMDYDGTLAPFHTNPAYARPYPEVVTLLDNIMENLRTRLVIVTGRWIQSLIPLLCMKRLPELWGSHGWEQLKPNGDYFIDRLNQTTLNALLEANRQLEDLRSLGVRLERKPRATAIHWRGLEPEQVIKIRAEIFQKELQTKKEGILTWHHFDGGIELRASGRDKGTVVEQLLSECDSNAVIAYLGDDFTDEDAFRALQGKGLTVLVRPKLRVTNADLWIQPPHELVEFLKRWQEATSNEHVRFA